MFGTCHLMQDYCVHAIHVMSAETHSLCIFMQLIICILSACIVSEVEYIFLTFKYIYTHDPGHLFIFCLLTMTHTWYLLQCPLIPIHSHPQKVISSPPPEHRQKYIKILLHMMILLCVFTRYVQRVCLVKRSITDTCSCLYDTVITNDIFSHTSGSGSSTQTTVTFHFK